MQRAIFEVYAKVVDANGAYNTLSGYPKVFDSKLYNNDVELARKRAYAAWYEVLGTMGKRDDRELQFAMVIDSSIGLQIELARFGDLAELPDPEPEPEPTPEPEGE